MFTQTAVDFLVTPDRIKVMSMSVNMPVNMPGITTRIFRDRYRW